MRPPGDNAGAPSWHGSILPLFQQVGYGKGGAGRDHPTRRRDDRRALLHPRRSGAWLSQAPHPHGDDVQRLEGADQFLIYLVPNMQSTINVAKPPLRRDLIPLGG